MQTLDKIDPERIGVLGWSQGGTDALLSAARRPEIFKSVVTWAGAPDMNLDEIINEDQYREAKNNGYYVMNFSWREPLKVSLRWCEDVKKTDVLSEFAAGCKGPVLAIHGKEDTTVDPVWCERIKAASTNPLSDSLYIDGMDHTFNVFAEVDLHSLMTAVDATGEYFNTTLMTAAHTTANGSTMKRQATVTVFPPTEVTISARLETAAKKERVL